MKIQILTSSGTYVTYINCIIHECNNEYILFTSAKYGQVSWTFNDIEMIMVTPEAL